MKKKVEIVVCDLDPKDKPAVYHVTITGLGSKPIERDLCRGHGDSLKFGAHPAHVALPKDPVSEGRGPEGKFPCPSCDFVAKAPQGLAAHRLKRHGVKGSSRSSVQKKRRRRLRAA